MVAVLDQPLPPGSVIGILGGGQLGRMAALAAHQLGYPCHIFCPQEDAPAFQVTSLATCAGYDDEEALSRFAEAVEVVTFEFENIPAKSLTSLAERVPVHPGPNALKICQNRLREKDFCNSVRVPTARYAEVTSLDSLRRVLRDLGTPAVLKTIEMGYDGKGQATISSASDLERAWQVMTGGSGQGTGILEAFVDFDLEISVIVARGIFGSMETYVPVENQHRNHILDLTIAPARVPPQVADRAEILARHLAEEIGLVGLLAVEMFVTRDGDVLVNELAPRPHNSGHWTMDACLTSQFEQFIRAVAGLPLGSIFRHSDAVMKNLLGDETQGWADYLKEPGAKLHLYGKAEARPGRKMGHVTRLQPKD